MINKLIEEVQTMLKSCLQISVLFGLNDGMPSTFLSSDASKLVKVRLADELNGETSF